MISIETTINQIKNANNEAEFKSIFYNASKIGEKVGVFHTNPIIVRIQKHRAKNNICNDDCCTCFKISIFYSCLDVLLSSFNKRFTSNSNILIALSCLLPSKVCCSTLEYLIMFNQHIHFVKKT